jgi:hypothetical protein
MILSRTERSSNKRFTGSLGTVTISIAPASGEVIHAGNRCVVPSVPRTSTCGAP